MRDVQGISQMNQVKGYMLSGLLSKSMMVLFLGIVLFSPGCTKKNTGNPEDAGMTISNKKLTDELTTSAVGLPGNKSNYVVVVMGGSNYAKFVRIAQYTFTASSGSSGTVSSQFKFWDQIFTGDAMTNKVATGYTTGNCIDNNCVIKTPIGFQPGQAWNTIAGTYTFSSNGKVVINWTGGQQETWTVGSALSYGVVPLTIWSSNYNLQHGKAYGSNASFNTGATISQIKAGGDILGEVWENVYGGADINKTNLWWKNSEYQVCTSGTSMQGLENQSLPTCDHGRWHRYVAGNPTTDKRKNYYNHQLGDVTCADDLYTGGKCISPQAGHTAAMLQVLADDGSFKGWVSAEASLHDYVAYQAVVNIAWYMKQ